VKVKLEKTSYSTVQEKARGNDPVPISTCRGRGMLWLVVELQ